MLNPWGRRRGGVVCIRRRASLVMVGSEGMVQFYDTVRDGEAARLNTTGRQYVLQKETLKLEDNHKYGIPTEPMVTLLAFHRKGETLATIQVIPGCGPAQPSINYLKFWDQNGDSIHSGNRSQPYLLNTTVDNPHMDKVTGLAFHPSENLAATCSMEGEFKVWELVGIDEQMRAGKSEKAPKWYWGCRSVGSFMESPMSGLAFAENVSCLNSGEQDRVLAVGCKGCVTLWKSMENLLLEKFQFPLNWESLLLTKIRFLKDSPFLVGFFQDYGIAVWNVNSGTLQWCMTLTATAFDVDLRGRGFYVAGIDQNDVHETFVMFYSAGSPQPLKTWRVSGPKPVALCCVPFESQLFEKCGGKKWDPISLDPVIVVSDNGDFREYCTLNEFNIVDNDNQSSETSRSSKRQKLDQDAESGVSSFEAVFGRTQKQLEQFQELQEEQQRQQQIQIRRAEYQRKIDSLFDGPTHLLPETSVLAQQFFDISLKMLQTKIE
eukprot:TRINITY_DN6699_c0_g2_i2.p1 TRINITY_DN6699_c0_g2~~TRINITY_DN6699_c0_g2_i2.p1  ORF type:complete len:490 (+),score=69.73 TRINITY_DN6699_c0_g2_i2:1138-2607(+)